jgi:hypothetical protein
MVGVCGDCGVIAAAALFMSCLKGATVRMRTARSKRISGRFKGEPPQFD